MDAIALLKKDHREVKALFEEFERLDESGSESQATKKRLQKIVDTLIRELAVHSALEETIFYPTVRAAAKLVEFEEADDSILESLEEHHIVKWTLSELEKLTPDDERFCAKVKVLMENVLHHADEEEKELFKHTKKLLAKEELDALGGQMERARKLMPTRPHPRAPDQPPGNLVAGMVSAVMDRGRDAVRDLMRSGTEKVRGRKKGGEDATVH